MQKLLRLLIILLPATLVTADYFAARWAAENGTASSPSTVLLLALLASQVALLSMWCTLSRRTWLVRLPVTLLGLLLLGLILVLGIDMGELTGSSFDPSPSLYNALQPFLPALVVAGPLLVLQCFDIAPVQHAPGTTNQMQGRLQFSIIHLVLLVTYVGMAFGMLKWMSQRRVRVLAVHDRLLVAAGEITMLLFYALITQPTLWAALGRRRALLRSVAVLVAAPALVIALAWYNSAWPENALVEGPLDTLALAAAACAGLHVLLLLAVLLLVRWFRNLNAIHGATVNSSRRSPDLILALTAAALVTSPTVAPPTYRLAKQLHAANHIDHAGGYVYWDHNNVVIVTFWRSPATDRSLQSLPAFTNLRELSLFRGSLSDESMKYIHGLSNLEELYADDCKITDAGLAHLAGLTRLESLTLNCSGSGITSQGLRHLAELTNLETLSLRNASVITDSGLLYLNDLPSLTWLDLTGTSVTDRGARSLQQNHPKLLVRH